VSHSPLAVEAGTAAGEVRHTPKWRGRAWSPMTMESLATVEAAPARLANLLETASIASSDADDREILVRIGPKTISTPASVPGADHAAYCTASADHVSRVSLSADRPVEALFDLATALAWLEWLGESAETVLMTFEGIPGSPVAEQFELVAGQTTVTVPCTTDWTADEVSYALTDRFAEGVFYDTADNEMPTRVRTDAATLARLTAAATLAKGERRIPLVVRDGALRLEVDGTSGTRVNGRLPATVEGPAVDTIYGPTLARVAGGLEGQIELQTGPGEPVAVVQAQPTFTLRYVVQPVTA
jgi:hypothetical protein